MLIVYVEDDDSYQATVRREFAARHYEVIIFENAVTALNYLEGTEPDILLTDFKLGGPTGLKLANRVRELYPACTIVLISAYATKYEVREAFRNGADDFLFKPIEIEELASDVLRAFQRRTALYPRPEQNPNNPIVFDDAHRTVQWNRHALKLTPIEYRLLVALMSNPQRLFDAQELYLIGAGKQVDPAKAKHIIGVHMVNLRAKFQQYGSTSPPIQNVRGKGYKWVAQELVGQSE